ncbi:hypothetical protein LEP1GSC058_4154 [Leptospira fainei serovar Hurstbridge str. BUT 6]|uniref:Uncharacterized protein n=1 Tax=Leptospira fainei serovar Hurstbridge str. BUT 6 TaxID=1193011 RepID=S3W1K5_9LEPT|nr:hypothetical protein LEP1GSC058_4154 [Leptospira fainei serovar Hurstbridge str. BUT 6]
MELSLKHQKVDNSDYPKRDKKKDWKGRIKKRERESLPHNTETCGLR